MALKPAPQQQIDTRAIEIAGAALTRVQAHEERCNANEERAAASRAELKQDMQAGFGELRTGMQHLGQTVHQRISDEKDARFRLVVGVAGAVIIVLLGVVAFLFIKAVGWS